MSTFTRQCLSLFSPIQVSLAQLFHVLCRQKGKPYLSVYKLAGLRPRRQWEFRKLICKYSGTSAWRRTKRPAEFVRSITRFSFIEILFHIFYNNCWENKIARNSSHRRSLYRGRPLACSKQQLNNSNLYIGVPTTWYRICKLSPCSIFFVCLAFQLSTNSFQK